MEVKELEGNRILSWLTMQQFFQSIIEVTVNAKEQPEDWNSGLEKVWYFIQMAPEGEVISERPSNCEEIEKLAAGAWKEGRRCTVEEDRTYVVYFKLKDYAGNISYLSSDDLVLDSQGPVIQIDYDRYGRWDTNPVIPVKVEDSPYGIQALVYQIDQQEPEMCIRDRLWRSVHECKEL